MYRYLLSQFPYPPPQANDPTKTLKSLVNIRKESLRLVRNMDQTSTSSHYRHVKHYGDGDIDKKPNRFNIEFVFDCDVRCAITIYYFSMEEISTKGVAYVRCIRKRCRKIFVDVENVELFFLSNSQIHTARSSYEL